MKPFFISLFLVVSCALTFGQGELSVLVTGCLGLKNGSVELIDGSGNILQVENVKDGVAKLGTVTSSNGSLNVSNITLSAVPNPVEDGFVTLSTDYSGDDAQFIFYDMSGKVLGSTEPGVEALIQLNTESGIVLYEFVSGSLGSKWGKLVTMDDNIQVQTIFSNTPKTSSLKVAGADDYTVKYQNNSGSITVTEQVYLPAGSERNLNIDLCSDLNIVSDKEPQIEFAVGDLRTIYEEIRPGAQSIEIKVEEDASKPEGYQIAVDPGTGKITIIGNDANGAMYAALDVAEMIKIGDAPENTTHTPFRQKRGLKLNIPIDARTPSYSDGGTAAQSNIEHIWDFEGFWKAQLDQMARYKYNVLSFWTKMMYSSMVVVPGYEDCALEDVYRVKPSYTIAEDIGGDPVEHFDDPKTGGNGDGNLTVADEGYALELVKKMTMEQKKAHWHNVFNYAKDRGMEIQILQWNVFAYNAIGKYEITQDQNNPKLRDFMRKSIKEALLEYPQIDCIGVTSGENDLRAPADTSGTEHYCYATYGKGIEDAKADSRFVDRDIRFIYRRHGMPDDLEGPLAVHQWFKDYTGGEVNTSIKYAVGHMYSSRRPVEFERRYFDDGWHTVGQGDGMPYKSWLNLRNDDIFYHRWGSPDFAKDQILSQPENVMIGYYKGSDGYFWGKEFVSKEASETGKLEIQKHWYRDKLWGELGYNINRDNTYWKKILMAKFGLSNANNNLLFDAWETASKIIPQLNRSTWAATDGDFAGEMCQEKGNFLTIQNYYYDRPGMKLTNSDWGIDNPHPDEIECMSIPEWSSIVTAGGSDFGGKFLPLQVAQRLDSLALIGENAATTLKPLVSGNIELLETIRDIESMSELGKYYADKQRAAAYLKLFLDGGRSNVAQHNDAVSYIEQSETHWRNYAALLDVHYNTSEHSKTRGFDWNRNISEVQAEVKWVKDQGDFPLVSFENLSDGDTKSNADLTVKVNMSSSKGLQNTVLYVNGLILSTPTKSGNDYTWIIPQAEIEDDWVKLTAVAKDLSGVETRKHIYVKVGTNSEDQDDWKKEMFLDVFASPVNMSNPFVISHKDDDGFLFKFDEMGDGNVGGNEARFTIDAEGKVKIRDGYFNATVCKTRSKFEPQHTTLTFDSSTGEFLIYAEEAKSDILRTPKNVGTAPYKFVMTRGRTVAVIDASGNLVWEEKMEGAYAPFY